MTQEGIRLLQTILATDQDQRLRPEAVLAAAQPEDSPLHEHFTWDDTAAGHQYRLHQARHLIRTVRVVNPQDMNKPPVMMFISLVNDRKEPGGGYRRLDDVLAQPSWREELMANAKRDLAAWSFRYRMLEDLVTRVQAAAEAVEVPPTRSRSRRRTAV